MEQKQHTNDKGTQRRQFTEEKRLKTRQQSKQTIAHKTIQVAVSKKVPAGSTLTFNVELLDIEEGKGVQDAFLSLDIDKNGFLDMNEVSQQLDKAANLNELPMKLDHSMKYKMLQTIFMQLDTDKDGACQVRKRTFVTHMAVCGCDRTTVDVTVCGCDRTTVDVTVCGCDRTTVDVTVCGCDRTTVDVTVCGCDRTTVDVTVWGCDRTTVGIIVCGCDRTTVGVIM
ncbi:hypothetical protein KUTeg_002348 [Tegillarca granosa]|uniref:peptidylprolyl isomerase n=1 Tax=Tegillarca granosa TaxID=220873 RepID=A0ABQ9FVH5_TEGGR|nr:hypothetical protein KUTeg_002348 [Tegillarca granosa]